MAKLLYKRTEQFGDRGLWTNFTEFYRTLAGKISNTRWQNPELNNLDQMCVLQLSDFWQGDKGGRVVQGVGKRASYEQLIVYEAELACPFSR